LSNQSYLHQLDLSHPMANSLAGLFLQRFDVGVLRLKTLVFSSKTSAVLDLLLSTYPCSLMVDEGSKDVRVSFSSLLEVLSIEIPGHGEQSVFFGGRT
jgi:hypothetical protein